jgi:hypothetical protein
VCLRLQFEIPDADSLALNNPSMERIAIKLNPIHTLKYYFEVYLNIFLSIPGSRKQYTPQNFSEKFSVKN